MTDIAESKPPTRRSRRMAREPQVDMTTAPPAMMLPQQAEPILTRTPSKSAQVLDLLQRAEGATLDQLATATGWLPHTARAALTGLRKKGHTLASEKVEGGSRVYRVMASAAASAGPSAP